VAAFCGEVRLIDNMLCESVLWCNFAALQRAISYVHQRPQIKNSSGPRYTSRPQLYW
jgi:hypothetical protein